MTASQVNGMPTAFPPPPPPPQPQGAPTHSLTHQANPYQSTPGQPMYGAHANNGQFEPETGKGKANLRNQVCYF